MNKKLARIKRARKARSKIAELKVFRLSVHRTSRHIYAQVFAPVTGEVVVSANTLQPEIKASLTYTGNKTAATVVGQKIAQAALAKGVESVAFDRSGFKYHGRIQALADSAREAGLKF